MSLNKFELDCRTCTEEQKKDRGCESNSPIPDRWQIGNEKFQRCPIKFIDNNAFWCIKAYNFLEKGILPRQGGWLDQANKFIEIMDFINSNRG